MKLTIVGGGGFRVPLVYGALLDDTAEPRVDEVVLHDVDPTRLDVIAHVLRQLAAGAPHPPAVSTTTNLDEALDGASFVFSAVRAGGLHGRVADERVALDLGVLGQETTGPGGIAYGLRSVPVALHIAARVRDVAPQAWVINFTNPAGMVTEAMSTLLGDRVIGICDSPTALCGRVARALGIPSDRAWFDYVGLNHLGWLRAVEVDGRDELPRLLADEQLLTSFEEGRLFGADWLRTLGEVPNEYLWYWYFRREAVAAAVDAAGETRGSLLAAQQQAFYDQVAREPSRALDEWRRVRRERDASYLAESRRHDPAARRDESDVAGGGYERVALAIMAAIARDERSVHILNVRNRGALSAFDHDAVVEVPCLVDGNGAHPCTVAPVEGHHLGLMVTMKAVERETIAAARDGSRDRALRAFALHPMVDSVELGRQLLDGYLRALPALAAALPES